MTYTYEISNGDLVRNQATGVYNRIQRKDKVWQDVEMTLSTDVRTGSRIGCGLDAAVGKDQFSASASYSPTPVMFEFQTLIASGLERLRRAQRQYQFSQRTADELIYDFSPVQMWQDLSDMRTIRWKVNVNTVDSRGSFSMNGSFTG